MSEELLENSTSSNCFICNSDVSLSKNALTIFNKETKTCSKRPLTYIMNQVLAQDLNEDSVHSELICSNCFTSFDKVDELEQKLVDLKLILISNYKDTMLKNKVSKIIKNKASELMKKVNEKENLVPKKILDIPSSDDESPEPISSESKKASLNTIDEIEKELEKMQEDKKEAEIYTATDADTILYVLKNDSNDDLDSESRDNTDALLRAAEMAEKSLTEKVKIEVGDEDLVNNILKRKAPSANSAASNKESNLPEKKIKIEFEPTMLVERDDDFYTCLLCDGDETVGGDAKLITQHIKEAHDLRIYICDVCGDHFKKRNELSAHLDDHVAAEEGDFQCEICNRIFSNLRLFRIHKRMHNPQNKLWNCEQCGKKYSSKNLLEEHQNTHTGIRPYVCQACGKDFASKYTFKAHEKTHEVRPRPFQCSQCDKSFLSQQNLTQHERTHSGIKEFSCHLCDKQFGSAHNLEVHSIVHTGYKPFECALCGKAFARKAEIRDHERTHTGERPYQCELCGATFSQRSNLQSHKRATHYDDKRYRCEECGKGFKRRRLLDYHIKAAHTGERPFKCNVCEATFVYPEHFKKHRRIHTGEKPFLCEVCGKAFNSRDNRNAHRFVHSDKKPYECLVCGAGFMRKPLLYQHMQSQGHLNDTIIVNQPRLNTDDGQIITVNSDGDMELVNQSEIDRLATDDDTQEDSKLYIADIAEHMLVDGSKVSEGTLILGDNGDDNEGVGHIIIDGQQIQFAEADEEEINEGVEDDEEMTAETYTDLLGSQIITGRSAQIIQTKEGPIQFVAVRIPNEKGESEEAWIKIVPDSTD